MPSKCDYCGEYKPCREVFLGLLGDTFGSIGKHIKVRVLPSSYYYYDIICEDCDKALKIKHKIKIKEFKENQMKEQRLWIKERNELLKEDSILL